MWRSSDIWVVQDYFLKPSDPDGKRSMWVSNPCAGDADADGACRSSIPVKLINIFHSRILHFRSPSLCVLRLNFKIASYSLLNN